MQSRLKRRILTLALVLVMSAGLFVAPVQSVVAGNFDGSTGAATEGACFGGTDCTAGTTEIDTVIKMVVDILSVTIGVIAVIMIIFAGFKYITSGGDGQKVANAKSTMVFAIIGLIVAALAQLIVWFVLGKTAGQPTPHLEPELNKNKTVQAVNSQVQTQQTRVFTPIDGLS